MQLTSPVFKNGEEIPPRYTCDEASVSPPLDILDAPSSTRSFVLTLEDPDAPRGTFDHWIVFNIPSSTTAIPEGQAPNGVAGSNSLGKTGYVGPCPPSGSHRYIFTLYALDTVLNLPAGANKAAVLTALADHITAKAELLGTYQRKK